MATPDINFVIVHAGDCPSPAHYRVRADGARLSLLPEDRPVQHARTIAVSMEGQFDDGRQPPLPQIDALHQLLIELRDRHGSFRVAGHRQVRGNDTSCPGDGFPLDALRDWARTTLDEALDRERQRDIDRQYNPLA